MKKILLGTTALVAASVMLVDVAAAQDKKAPGPVTLGLGGYFQAEGAYVDQDADTNLRDHQILREAEVWFLGQTRLDNGLLVGARVELEAETCTDQIDQSFLFMDMGTFGRIEVGQTDGAPIKMVYGSVSPFRGKSGLIQANVNYNRAGAGIIVGRLGLGDFEKITYFTPRIAGFQVGVSYAPDGCEESDAAPGTVGGAITCGGSSSGTETEGDNHQSEIFEAAINFVETLGGFNVAAYAGTIQAQAERGANPTNVLANNRQDDFEGYAVGAQVGFGPFTVAGFSRWDNVAASNRDVGDNQAYGASARYAFAPFSVAIEYAMQETERSTTTVTEEHQLISIGGTYVMGPGIELYGGVQFFDIQDAGAAGTGENDGTVILFGTFVAF